MGRGRCHQACRRSRRIAHEAAAVVQPAADAAATHHRSRVVVGSMEPMLRRLVLDEIAIRVTASHVPIHIRADESALSQIVLNLVVNARDAMPDGGTATIETGHRRLDGAHRSSLGIPARPIRRHQRRDTGQGIPPEIQRHLFEPFFTTKAPDQGTGLGLSIVYGIVKGLGGAIEVQSEVGRGATFTIYLPLVSTVIDSRSVASSRQSLDCRLSTSRLTSQRGPPRRSSPPGAD